MNEYDKIPDVRDGLTREERIVLYVLHETQKERGGRNVPTTMLWGRVCEHFYISPEDLSLMLARLGARKCIERVIGARTPGFVLEQVAACRPSRVARGVVG